MPGRRAVARCATSVRASRGGRLGGVASRRMDKACDVKYKTMDSPLGKIEMSGCGNGLHEIKLLGQKIPEAHPSVAPASLEETAEPLAQCAAWLEAYFQDPTAIEGFPVPAFHHPIFQQDSFTRRVLWKLLKAVGVGQVLSYQQLAALAGNPRAARAVGSAMRNNPVPILIPCHRVITSSGAVGNYTGGLGVKEWLLAHEGVQAGADLSGARVQLKPGTGLLEVPAEEGHAQRE